MDNDLKELLAKAKKMKKMIADGSVPFDIELEDKACFGMHDNFQSIRSMIDKIPDKPRKKKNK